MVVKGLLRKAVRNNYFFYHNAEEIQSYFSALFKNDNEKHHFLLPVKIIHKRRKQPKSALKKKDCIKLHIISFYPVNSIQTRKCVHALTVSKVNF